MELLQRVADADGRILRIQRLVLEGARTPVRAAAFLLTFDVGRLLVGVDPEKGGLTILHLELGDDPPGELLVCDEEDPWWRVLGSALTRVVAIGDGLRLQFREDDDNPRVVTLEPAGLLVQVGLEPVA